MKLSTHLTFNGHCQTAFKFYERCLGGKIVTMLTWGNSPLADQAPAGWSDKILHATMMVGESVLMGVDLPDADTPTGFFVSLAVDTPEAAESVFHALAENGKVQMPLQKTLWVTGLRCRRRSIWRTVGDPVRAGTGDFRVRQVTRA